MGQCLACGSEELSAYVQTFADALFKDLVNFDLVVGLASQNIGKILAGSKGFVGAVKFVMSDLKTAPRVECETCGSRFLACPHCGSILVPDRAPSLGDQMQCGICFYMSAVG